MIGEGRVLALSKSQNWPAGPVILKMKNAFSKSWWKTISFVHTI